MNLGKIFAALATFAIFALAGPSLLAQTVINNNTPAGAFSLGNSPGKTNVLQTGQSVSVDTNVNHFFNSYTVPAGQTLYLQYVNLSCVHQSNAQGVIQTTAATDCGFIALESPAGTPLFQAHLQSINSHSDQFSLFFAEPIPIAAAQVVRVNANPKTSAAVEWDSNYGGYVK